MSCYASSYYAQKYKKKTKSRKAKKQYKKKTKKRVVPKKRVVLKKRRVNVKKVTKPTKNYGYACHYNKDGDSTGKMHTVYSQKECQHRNRLHYLKNLKRNPRERTDLNF